jgi:adenine phosphoribosyltransferase
VKSGHTDLYKLIRDCPDFPKKGILFRDVSPVFQNPDALHYICEELSSRFNNYKVDLIAGIESRGFILATGLALKSKKGLIMLRKAGKLPGVTIRRSYEIEYGNGVIEIQRDALRKDDYVLIADDLIATGGTARAAANLVESVGGRVTGFAFIIELAGLDGANILRNSGYHVTSLTVYH